MASRGNKMTEASPAAWESPGDTGKPGSLRPELEQPSGLQEKRPSLRLRAKAKRGRTPAEVTLGSSQCYTLSQREKYI